MAYKPHGLFTAELYDYLKARMPNLGDKFNGDTAYEIVKMSRMGLLPEAAEIPSDSPYWPEMRRLMESNPGPISPAPKPVVNLESIVEASIPHYVFGSQSIERLKTLKPELRACVVDALGFTTQDFTVLQTTRSLDEQKKAVAGGNSRTMHSKHLPQPQDHGLAWAVDLGAWVNNKVSWDFDRYADIAFAMDQAATQLGFAHHVRWGCAWDRVLDDFGGSHKAYLDEAQAYAKRHEGSDLIDAPHFEWVA